MGQELHGDDVVILSAARTPSGRFQGSLSGFSAPQLGAFVIKAAIERAGIPDPGDVDEVLMGNVVSAGLGQAPARQATLFAGLPPSVGATAINKVCGSGLNVVSLSVMNGSTSIFSRIKPVAVVSIATCAARSSAVNAMAVTAAVAS